MAEGKEALSLSRSSATSSDSMPFAMVMAMRCLFAITWSIVSDARLIDNPTATTSTRPSTKVSLTSMPVSGANRISRCVGTARTMQHSNWGNANMQCRLSKGTHVGACERKLMSAPRSIMPCWIWKR